MIEGHGRLGPMRLRRILIVASVVGCGACLPASSQAVTIGSNLAAFPGTNTSNSCGAGVNCTTTWWSVALPAGSTAPGGLTSPIDGVIVRFRLRHNSLSASPVELRVIQSASGGTFQGAGTSTPPQPLSSVAEVQTFAARLPIAAGDYVGIDAVDTGTSQSFTNSQVGTTGATTDENVAPRLEDGVAATPTFSFPNRELLLNADVEADTDRDGFGDETQDACPGAAGPVNGCPQADLQITKSVSPNPVPVNGILTYTLAVKNNGPTASGASFATVTDNLPAAVSFLAATSTSGSCVGGATVTCQLGSIAAGATATVTIQVRANQAGTVSNGASVAYTGDTNPANNSASASATVNPPPSVTSAKVVPATFRLGSLLPKISRKKPHVGTTISFKVSVPARATLTFSQPKPGRRVGRRCVKPTRSNRHKRRCTIPNVRGTLTFNGHAGTNRVRFQGRLSRTRRLKPGRYIVTITATDSAGNRSLPKSTSFTIVR